MKKTSFMIIFLFIFSLVICQGQIYGEADLYKKIDTEMCKIYESGLKLEYSTTKKNEQAIKDVETILGSNFGVKLNNSNINDGFFSVEKNKENFNFKISINKELSYSQVAIEIIDKKGIMDIESVKKVLDKLLDNTTNNSRYFSYVKGKIESNNELAQYENELINIIGDSKIQKNDTLLMNNGVTGSMVLKNKYELNYSIMKYGEDIYLIIGTPVIFTTY